MSDPGYTSMSDHINAMHLYDVGDLDAILQSSLGASTLQDGSLSKFHAACNMANPQAVSSHLEQDVDVNVKGCDGNTAAHFLCNREDSPVVRVQIMEELYKNGLDINAVNDAGRTPVHLACLNSQTGMVDFLIKSGANVNTTDDYCNTPFSVACKLASEGWYFFKTDLMNEEGSEDKCNDEDFAPPQICKSLLKAGAANPTSATLLPSAVLYSNMSVVEEFLDLGLDVNAVDDMGRSPLSCACSTSNIPSSMVRLLLERGADPNEEGSGMKSKPITYAYVYNSVEKIRLLLSYGATVSPEEMSELVSLSIKKSFLENPDIIQEESLELVPWRLLMKAGFRPLLRGSDLSVKLNRVSLCSSSDQVRPIIDSLMFDVPSLSELCRVSIRSRLQPSKDNNISQLPLPSSLKQFLQYNEFW